MTTFMEVSLSSALVGLATDMLDRQTQTQLSVAVLKQTLAQEQLEVAALVKTISQTPQPGPTGQRVNVNG
jgi:hypothetical protein